MINLLRYYVQIIRNESAFLVIIGTVIPLAILFKGETAISNPLIAGAIIFHFLYLNEDDKQANVLLLSLPVTRKQYVSMYYLIGFVTGVFSFLVIYLGKIFLGIVTPINWFGSEHSLISILGVHAFIFGLFIALVIPLRSLFLVKRKPWVSFLVSLFVCLVLLPLISDIFLFSKNAMMISLALMAGFFLFSYKVTTRHY